MFLSSKLAEHRGSNPHSSRSRWSAAALLVLITGCSDSGTPDELALGVSTQALYRTGNLWPTGYTATRVVPVCFTAAAMARSDFAAKRDTIRNTLNRSWASVANVWFTGFGDCGASANGKVQIDFLSLPRLSSPGGPPPEEGGDGGWSQVGYRGPDTKVKMRLSTTLSQSVTVHEFGHALGFHHEMTRPDFIDDAPSLPGNCHEDNLSGGDTLGTPANERESIMASGYCNDLEDLSPWDIVGVENAYGRKPAGSIVGMNNSCLEVPGFNFSQGTNLTVYPCHGASNQVWSRTTVSTLYVDVGSGHVGYLDVEGAAAVNSAPVELIVTGFFNRPSQVWTFENTRLVAMGNKCVEVPNGNFTNGQQLKINTCNDGANQKWVVEADGRIRNGAWCIDVAGGSTAASTPVQVYQCNGGAAQRFGLHESGNMRFGGMCVDVAGGEPTDGSPLVLWPCKSASDVTRKNQEFHLRGEIRSLGKCLDIGGGVPYEGAPVVLYQCHGGANQQWEYYWK